MLMCSYLECSLFCKFVTEFNQPAVRHSDVHCIHLFVALLTSDPLSDEIFKYLVETIMATFLGTKTIFFIRVSL